MKNRSARALFLVLGVVAGCLSFKMGGYRASAQYSNSVQVTTPLRFVLKAAGDSPIFQTNGANFCSITFDSVGVNANITVLGSTDNGNLYKTLTQFPNAGIIAPPVVGTQYAGSTISGQTNALTNFKFNLASVDSGVVSGWITCGSAGGGGSGGGGGGGTVQVSPIPLPVVLPTCNVALPCAQVSSLPGPAVTTNPGGYILVAPTAFPTCGTAFPCVQVSGAPSPVPVPTASPGLLPVVQHYKNGSGSAVFLDTVPDTLVIGSTISGAATNLIISGVANQNLYLFYLAIMSTGTNTAATAQLKLGTGATCTGSPVTFPSTLSIGATAGITTVLIGSAAEGSTGQGLGVLAYLLPAAQPLIVVSGATPVNVCIVSVSATESWQAIEQYAIHAN